VHAEESRKSDYTCLMCLKAFKDPVACVPCGHVFCRCCVESTGSCGQSWCQECGGAPVREIVPLAQMDKLASKRGFVLSALADLQRRCMAERILDLSTTSVGGLE
jgi:hypothetical protein